MTGSLFRNDRKESDNHPDYKGSALLGGVDHWMDAWINTDRNGNKYMSVKFKPKEALEPQAKQRWTANEVTGDADLDDDVPF
jgi:uncharacterized protein (DUF736 family)